MLSGKNSGISLKSFFGYVSKELQEEILAVMFPSETGE